MADSYREYQPLRAPPWLQDDDGAAWEAEFGGAKDTIQEQLRQGITARFPDFAAELGAPDALAATGAERLLPPGYRQTDEQFAATLKNAWSLWPGTEDAPGGAGSHAGMLRELKRQGFWPAVIVQDNGRWTTLDTDGVLSYGWLMTSATRGRPDWRFYDPDRFFSRFAIVFPGPVTPVLQVTATAVFNGTDRATATWSQPWDDILYLIAASPPITSGPIPGIALDETSKTPQSIDVIATAAFTGTVSLLSWRPGDDPLSGPSASSRIRLAELARRWKPASMTYDGAFVITQGGLWGWPIDQEWGEVGDTWDANSATKIEPL